jgi:hypothetical protein
MINARRQNKQVILLQENSNPLIALVSNIKISASVSDISDLLILMHVLGEKRLDFLFVDVPHLLRGHGDHIAVLVAACRGESVDLRDFREVVVNDADAGEGVDGYVAAGVVGFTLVALRRSGEHSGSVEDA